jgi:hypothetical protein
MMDSLLGSSPVTEVIPQEAPPVDPDAPDLTEEPSPNEVEETEELAENEVPPADDDEEDEDLASIKDGKKYRVNSTKMKRLLEASKMVKAVQEHFEPTPEALLEHYGAATSYKNMTTDFRSADPTNITEFMNHWSGESPEGFAVLAQNLPAFLANKGMTGPLQNIERQVLGVAVQRAYNEVAQIAAIPEKDRSAAEKAQLYRAQALDYALNKTYKKDTEIQQMASRPRGPQIDQERQRFEQQQKNFHDSRWADFDQQYITGAKESALNGAIDAAFKPVEGKYSEKMLNSLKNSARRDVEDAISKRSEWKRNQDIEIQDIQREFRQALKTNSKTNLATRIEPLVGDYRIVINRLVPGIVKGLTGAATKAVVDESNANHDRLARGARQTAPSAGGTTAPRKVQGENYKQALDRVFG